MGDPKVAYISRRHAGSSRCMENDLDLHCVLVCYLSPASGRRPTELSVPSGGGFQRAVGAVAQVDRSHHHRAHHRHDRAVSLRRRLLQGAGPVVDRYHVSPFTKGRPT